MPDSVPGKIILQVCPVRPPRYLPGRQPGFYLIPADTQKGADHTSSGKLCRRADSRHTLQGASSSRVKKQSFRAVVPVMRQGNHGSPVFLYAFRVGLSAQQAAGFFFPHASGCGNLPDRIGIQVERNFHFPAQRPHKGHVSVALRSAETVIDMHRRKAHRRRKFPLIPQKRQRRQKADRIRPAGESCTDRISGLNHPVFFYVLPYLFRKRIRARASSCFPHCSFHPLPHRITKSHARFRFRTWLCLFITAV